MRTFVTTYSDLIADDLLAAFQEMFNTRIMPQIWKEGLVCLILKGDIGTNEVKCWCPFILLNTIYKIYAKALQGFRDWIINGKIQVLVEMVHI